ncbi:hypothetical protein H2201_009027 [Coniosporium apollinis]|uniref:Chromo domain-containing protein n=1 Tax=Coniosporium apollinis TaxID=61459 RepID=A0ABQ9NFE8_9PEZI|nr:hypothetical protein H2201_009027 [Coniosporium apollinis]
MPPPRPGSQQDGNQQDSAQHTNAQHGDSRHDRQQQDTCSDHEPDEYPLLKLEDRGDHDGALEKVVNWTADDVQSKHLITRLESALQFTGANELDSKDFIGHHDKRNGNRKEGGEFLYNIEHFIGICGVAWAKGNSTMDDLRLIDPANKGRKRGFPLTYVLVRWKKDTVSELKWEDRYSIRRLLGEAMADNVIFIAAKEQERRYFKHVAIRR